MKNSKKFIKSWEKKRRKGKKKYIVSSIVIYSVGCWIPIIIYSILRGYEFSKLSTALVIFFFGFIGVPVGMNNKWYINEKKYNLLLRIK